MEAHLRDSEDDQPPFTQAVFSLASQRSLGSSKTGTPVVLSPEGGSSPTGSTPRNGRTQGDWTDLDKFYESDSDNGNDPDIMDGRQRSQEISGESEDEDESEEESD